MSTAVYSVTSDTKGDALIIAANTLITKIIPYDCHLYNDTLYIVSKKNTAESSRKSSQKFNRQSARL